MAGTLIAFEGISGVGKTKHSRLLENWLERNRIQTLHIREPSNSAFGSLIKETIVDCNKMYHKTNPVRAAKLEALLFAADRIRQFYARTLPALRQGKVVISDRSLYSSYAYQGARHLDQKFIYTLNKPINKPDLVIILDIDVKIAMDRLKSKSSKQPNFDAIFDTENLLKKARRNYLSLARRNSQFIKLINTQKPIDEIQKEIRQLVYSHLRGRGFTKEAWTSMLPRL